MLKLGIMKTATFQIIGKDRPGIIAQTTTAIFASGANIISLEEKVVNGVFSMTLNANITKISSANLTQLKKRLNQIKNDLDLDIHLNLKDAKQRKNLAILVTKEDHCLKELVRQCRLQKIRAKPVVVISNRADLAKIVKKMAIPFVLAGFQEKVSCEQKIVRTLKKFNADFLALARYMQILSPEFVARYEGRIINIHPSLLPAFPGARPYEQAIQAGVGVVGVTAHFVTTDLDRGPVIQQEAFKIQRNATLTKVQTKGQKLEAKVLAQACELFARDKLFLRWGKVNLR